MTFPPASLPKPPQPADTGCPRCARLQTEIDGWAEAGMNVAGELVDAKDRIAELEKRVSELDAANSALVCDLSDRDDRIAELREELAEIDTCLGYAHPPGRTQRKWEIIARNTRMAELEKRVEELLAYIRNNPPCYMCAYREAGRDPLAGIPCADLCFDDRYADWKAAQQKGGE